MKHYTEKEIHVLIEKLSLTKLSKEEWTHEAHLVVAIWYSLNFDFETSVSKVRTLILQHNDSVGTPNSDTGGYHETLTRVWLQTARRFLVEYAVDSIEEVCNGFIRSPYASRDFPLRFYSKELLFSTEARKNWVEPNLMELVF